MIFTCQHCHTAYTDIESAAACIAKCEARQAARARSIREASAKVAKLNPPKRKPQTKLVKAEPVPKVPREWAPKPCLKCGQRYERDIGTNYRLCDTCRAYNKRVGDTEHATHLPMGGAL